MSAEALVEQWAKEQGEKMYGGASKGSGSTKSKKNKKKKWYADGYDGYFRARTEADAGRALLCALSSRLIDKCSSASLLRVASLR